MIKLEDYHFGERLSFEQYHPESLTYDEHLHRSFELLICRAGKVQITVNDTMYTLKKNDLLFVLPYQLHWIQTPDYSELDILIFSPEYVSDFYSKTEKCSFDFPVITLDAALIEQLYFPLFDTDSLFFRKAALYLIIHHFDQETRLVPDKGTEGLLAQLLIYIEMNFKENITLDNLSQSLGYSNIYISKFIAKYLGTTFPKLLNHHRVNHACYLLLNSSLSITSIATEVGFQNVRTFNRNFQAFIKMTPKEYRITRDISFVPSKIIWYGN